MTRRIVLATCLVGLIGGAAGTALADTASASKKPNQVCVVIYKNNGTTQDYCVDWTAVSK
jgi:hypothetical protein